MADFSPGPNQLDPLGDAERLGEAGTKKNFAKVGSARPSSLMFTYGPGAIVELPHFTVMPSGLDAWERIWARRDGIPHVHAPKLLDAVRRQLGQQVLELRPFPHQPTTSPFDDEGRDLGIPARVFPQWLRCTGCDRLAGISTFEYKNTHPYRPDEAKFEHVGCPGRGKGRKGGGRRRSLALPARYLLTCTNGHLDEFPYELWVHHGQPCPTAAVPALRMTESTLARGASSTIRCNSCGASRTMSEAQGAAGQAKLPACRGRHPHLDAYATGGCNAVTHLILIGASNLWFPILQRVIVLPMDAGEHTGSLADRLRVLVGEDLTDYVGNLGFLRKLLKDKLDITKVSDEALAEALDAAIATPDPSEEAKATAEWSPLDLIAPEWMYLTRGVGGQHHEDEASGLTLSQRPIAPGLPSAITRVLAVERLREASALLGFTRLDALDRIDDEPARRAQLSLTAPRWAVATLNRGEGIFLEFDEQAISDWEARVEASTLWGAHVEAHRRNFANRLSSTATNVDPDSRLRPPRYWLLHTFAHVLLREMAMSSGYGAASISERLYAWQADGQHPAAAGLLLLTTSSDSDGTLGGLVQLSEPERLRRIVDAALGRARRCSSDPICAHRTPKDPEDFLHGAACHNCTMASETSCETANRFLDRRFLIGLPGEYTGLGFFEVSS
ncbi:hypothetical protein SAMN02745244_01495 [Tessaracoccus bendigoensis DSM 12906]|uniref:MrfA-like Zn-binding domain-containing protein n=1 Tax=Tessaracoccus bendigoensis DSM 12906 TaxID=1123357 RepID=A0A1M6FP17_9ACTN|nr:DUF1998 domain-containing protein [Tessaracoccus bendigoensis]SHI99403.1 hypothetical protein SAMN02745244_01495 [Tessaracoccus bendigoensis DSM 12906]